MQATEMDRCAKQRAVMHTQHMQRKTQTLSDCGEGTRNNQTMSQAQALELWNRDICEKPQLSDKIKGVKNKVRAVAVLSSLW